MPTSPRIRYKGRGRTGGVEPRPLRKRNKRCNGRATARVAPTEALQGVQQNGPSGTPAPTERLQGVRWAGDRKGRPYGEVTRGAAKRAVGDAGPYESVTRGAMGGRPQGSPLRRGTRNVWAGYRPLRKFFDREGMVCFGFWWRRMTRAPGC